MIDIRFDDYVFLFFLSFLHTFGKYLRVNEADISEFSFRYIGVGLLSARGKLQIGAREV